MFHKGKLHKSEKSEISVSDVGQSTTKIIIVDALQGKHNAENVTRWSLWQNVLGQVQEPKPQWQKCTVSCQFCKYTKTHNYSSNCMQLDQRRIYSNNGNRYCF